MSLLSITRSINDAFTILLAVSMATDYKIGPVRAFEDAAHPYAHTLCPALTPSDEAPADRADRLERVPQLFLDALFVAMQNERGRAGSADDLRWCAGLCSATWREEALWNGMVHVRRGRRKRTHLMYAAMRGDVERVRWLIARGAPL